MLNIRRSPAGVSRRPLLIPSRQSAGGKVIRRLGASVQHDDHDNLHGLGAFLLMSELFRALGRNDGEAAVAKATVPPDLSGQVQAMIAGTASSWDHAIDTLVSRPGSDG